MGICGCYCYCDPYKAHSHNHVSYSLAKVNPLSVNTSFQSLMTVKVTTKTIHGYSILCIKNQSHICMANGCTIYYNYLHTTKFLPKVTSSSVSNQVIALLRTDDTSSTVVHWFLCTTDAGPNECGARKILAVDVADQPNTFFADFTCLEHSQHLVSLSCLKAADRCLAKHRAWSYYASLATCSNVCRSLCKAIFDAWAQRHGYRSAKDECRKLWPKASSGRWSGCDKPEQRFLQTGMDKLAPIMMNVLSKSEDNDKKHSCVEIDELQIEESKAFSAKMGRWRKRAKECFSDNLWWVTVGIMNACRGPLTHLQNFLQKPVDHHDQGEHWGHVARLSTGKAADISRGFNDVWPRLVSTGILSEDCGDPELDADAQFARNMASLVLSWSHRSIVRCHCHMGYVFQCSEFVFFGFGFRCFHFQPSYHSVTG